MKGNQYYTEKQIERMANEPAKDDGWGREPVRRPSKLETLKAQLDAETKRAEYYAKRASEIEEAQFRLANEIDDAGTEIDTLRARIAELDAERDKWRESARLASVNSEDWRKACLDAEADRDALRGVLGAVRADRDALRDECEVLRRHRDMAVHEMEEARASEKQEYATKRLIAEQREKAFADRDALRAVVDETLDDLCSVLTCGCLEVDVRRVVERIRSALGEDNNG